MQRRVKTRVLLVWAVQVERDHKALGTNPIEVNIHPPKRAKVVIV